MKLLTQADDFGFTKGVIAGIIDAIENGILRNTGLFMNMPGTTEKAAAYAKANPDKACYGIDFNLVSGPCVADPKEIPHLVDEDGNFIRSNIRIKDPRWQTEEGKKEMFPMEEVRREVRAQYDHFVELVGRKPGYLHTHSLQHANYWDAIREVASDENIPFSHDIRAKLNVANPLYERNLSAAASKKTFDPMAQINQDPEGLFWRCRDELLTYEKVAVGSHTGFVDATLFALTSLSIERVRDHQMMTSKRIMDWIKENGVELITYYDLVK